MKDLERLLATALRVGEETARNHIRMTRRYDMLRVAILRAEAQYCVGLSLQHILEDLLDGLDKAENL